MQQIAKSGLKPYEYIVVALLCVAAFLAVPWSYNNFMAHTAPQSILGISSVAWTKIDDILCKAKSPACGTGQALSHEGWNHDIDAGFALAVFHQGSNFGKLPCTAQLAACITFDRTWAQSYDDWYAVVKNQYVQKGLTTVPQVVTAMAPPNEATYAQSVASDMKSWQDLA